MSTELKLSKAIDEKFNDTDPEELRREFNRTPQPYLKHGLEITQTDHNGANDRDPGRGALVPEQGRAGADEAAAASGEGWRSSGVVSVAGSESGTEADDERPNFVRLLPPPALRPRKGLRVGESNEEVLLTPSQLDDEGRLSKNRDYFSKKAEDVRGEAKEDKEEQEKLFRRRLNEFARRTSEVALVGVILICVLFGQGVGTTAWQWKRELLSHITITAMLILAYPIKLSIVDTSASYSKPWQRFRVPASFDPATALYPPFLPVLVALSVSPLNPAIILPNVIIGLSSLPQRLFPRSSRLGGINVVHWLVAIIPLIVAENTAWPRDVHAPKPYMLKVGPPTGLTSETLIALYPLHQALLQPLQYLTTTSLLITELHLLSAGLVNLLLFAQAPQAAILKACLWMGGLSLFAFCNHVLHWNVTLARVPRWKLRRVGHTADERKSLVDAVTNLIQLQRSTSAFRSVPETADSDADEDKPVATLKDVPNGRPKLTTSHLKTPSADAKHFEPQSAIEPRKFTANGTYPEFTASGTRPRRNTLPSRPVPEILPRETSSRSKVKSANLLWCLQLTPTQVQHRKWLYAGYVYAAVMVIILVPVKSYVSNKALDGQEPVGWALSYLFNQIGLVRSTISTLGLQCWIPLSSQPGSFYDLRLSVPLDVPGIRSTLGSANVRLLLIAYWALVLLAGLLAVFNLTAYVEVDTRRKVFHGVMVAMLLPATFVDPCYCALALSLVLAVFLLLEVIRAGQVPPLGNAIGRFVAPYVDGRDLRGPVVVSHIFLLIGCAVPLWFSLAGTMRAGDPPWKGWELDQDQRDVAMIAGVVCVGMGDAAASLIGRRYGRHKWLWVGGKSLEGSAAFAAAVTLGLMFAKAWLAFGGWRDAARPSAMEYRDSDALQIAAMWLVSLAKAVFCACAASFMEAVLTGANDNVVVPVVLWLLVKGTRL